MAVNRHTKHVPKMSIAHYFHNLSVNNSIRGDYSVSYFLGLCIYDKVHTFIWDEQNYK